LELFAIVRIDVPQVVEFLPNSASLESAICDRASSFLGFQLATTDDFRWPIHLSLEEQKTFDPEEFEGGFRLAISGDRFAGEFGWAEFSPSKCIGKKMGMEFRLGFPNRIEFVLVLFAGQVPTSNVVVVPTIFVVLRLILFVEPTSQGWMA
jgi:hypothetical protein